VAAGGATSCGVAISRAGYCWGFDAYGGLGDGHDAFHGDPVVQFRLLPVAVVGGLSFESILAGRSNENFGCGLTVGGKVWCWGQNAFGELGDGTTDQRSTPAPIALP
jgi:alpha-tubulin suppressor-like RCC1 family protein